MEAPLGAHLVQGQQESVHLGPAADGDANMVRESVSIHGPDDDPLMKEGLKRLPPGKSGCHEDKIGAGGEKLESPAGQFGFQAVQLAPVLGGGS